MKDIKITTEYIKLGQLLKFSGTVSIGTEAAGLIAGGNIKVNGETCLMRGKKLYPGDIISVNGEEIRII